MCDVGGFGCGCEVCLRGPCAFVRPRVPRVSRVCPGSPRWGDGGFVIEFGGVCYQDTYPMYLTCIVHVSCMYLDVSRQDTSRYIEIQQDTFVSVTLAIIGNVSYLRISILLYDTFRIQ